MALARSPWRFFLAPFRRANYRSIGNARRAFEHPAQVLYRYVTNRGEYPHTITVRTPTGPLAIELPTYHDLRTVNEVFNRNDYAASETIDVVIDLGANIGISALYFLSRNTHSRVYCYEPSPVNLDRLHDRLAPFGDRAIIDERAVSGTSGTFPFNAEPIGRYGGLLNDTYTEPVVDVINVEAIDVNTMLESVLAREGRIDMLKIDTEGSELPIVKAIRPDLLAQIDEIYLEATLSEPLFPGRFTQTGHVSGVCRLKRLQA